MTTRQQQQRTRRATIAVVSSLWQQEPPRDAGERERGLRQWRGLEIKGVDHDRHDAGVVADLNNRLGRTLG